MVADRVVVLGDMLELGGESHSYHVALGEEAANVADVLFAVGRQADAYASGFKKRAPGAPCYHFETMQETLATLQACLRPGDAMLIKGSHGGHLGELVIRVRSMQNPVPRTLDH